MNRSRIRAARRGVHRLPLPGARRPVREIEDMTTGERRRRIEQLEAELAASGGDCEAIVAGLAAEIGVPPDEHAVATEMARRADARGNRSLAARWRRLADAARSEQESAPARTAADVTTKETDRDE
jgi:hypothetical protein